MANIQSNFGVSLIDKNIIKSRNGRCLCAVLSNIPTVMCIKSTPTLIVLNEEYDENHKPHHFQMILELMLVDELRYFSTSDGWTQPDFVHVARRFYIISQSSGSPCVDFGQRLRSANVCPSSNSPD